MSDNTELLKNISESERVAFAIMPRDFDFAFTLIMDDVIRRIGWMHYPMGGPVMKSVPYTTHLPIGPLVADAAE